MRSRDVARFAGLARAIARDFYLPGADEEDLRQEALIAVWVALRDYDPGANPNLDAWVAFVIRRRLRDAVRAALRHRALLLTRSVREAEGEDGDLAPVVELLPARDGDPHRELEARDRLRAVFAGLGSLAELEQRALVGVALGLVYEELGRPKAIDNAVQRARRKLREAA